MITSHNFMIQMLGREAKVKVFNFLLFDFWGLNVSTEEDFQPLIQITCISTFKSAFLLKIKPFFFSFHLQVRFKMSFARFD